MAHARAMHWSGDVNSLQIQCLPETKKVLNSPGLIEMFKWYQQARDQRR
jgi:hypothetical protein